MTSPVRVACLPQSSQNGTALADRLETLTPDRLLDLLADEGPAEPPKEAGTAAP